MEFAQIDHPVVGGMGGEMNAVLYPPRFKLKMKKLDCQVKQKIIQQW